MCETQANCPAEAACVGGACQLRACFSNTDCPIEHRCALEEGQCVAGCESDRDCTYGDACSGGTCVDKPCTSSAIDCDAGQYCDLYTGQCFDAAGPYCQPCDANTNCGGGNSGCFYVSGEGPYCLPECDATRPCPAGFDCIPITDGGEVAYFVCATLCNVVLDAQSARPATSGDLKRVGP